MQVSRVRGAPLRPQLLDPSSAPFVAATDPTAKQRLSCLLLRCVPRPNAYDYYRLGAPAAPAAVPSTRALSSSSAPTCSGSTVTVTHRLRLIIGKARAVPANMTASFFPGSPAKRFELQGVAL